MANDDDPTPLHRGTAELNEALAFLMAALESGQVGCLSFIMTTHDGAEVNRFSWASPTGFSPYAHVGAMEMETHRMKTLLAHFQADQNQPCPHGHEDWDACPVCGH